MALQIKKALFESDLESMSKNAREKYLAFHVCSCLSCLSFLFNDFIDKGNGAMHEDVVLWIACGAIYDTVIPLGIILAYSKLR